MSPAAPALSFDAALAALAWQVELGVTEAVGDAGCDRFAEAVAVPPPTAAAPSRQPEQPVAARPAASVPGAAVGVIGPAADPVLEARALADAAGTLEALRAAMEAYPHCELRRGARNFVFADGRPGARVMVIGEAPGREEDLDGRPFVGPAGRLLDRMFAAIGLRRDHPDPARALYITNVMPWRPPQNRKPERDEVAMMLPFLERHVALADPAVLVLTGNTPCGALLGREGIVKLRGGWVEVLGRPALPTFHTSYLLRNPAAKREAWADMLALQDRLRHLT